MSRTTKTVLWLLVAVVAIGALLIPRLQSSRTDAPVAVAGVQPLEVETVIVQPHRLVERFSTVGTIRADEWVEIRSEISGILEKVSFDEGALVRKGQVLVQIDDDQLLATCKEPEGRHQLVGNRLFYEQLKNDWNQRKRKYGRNKGAATRGLTNPSLFPQVMYRPLSDYDRLVQGGASWNS